MFGFTASVGLNKDESNGLIQRWKEEPLAALMCRGNDRENSEQREEAVLQCEKEDAHLSGGHERK